MLRENLRLDPDVLEPCVLKLVSAGLQFDEAADLIGVSERDQRLWLRRRRFVNALRSAERQADLGRRVRAVSTVTN